MRALFIAILAVAALGGTARGQNALTITEVRLDRPTLHTVGIQVLISGDANRDAAIAVRWRAPGSGTFRTAMPLFRVLPETVVGWTVPEQLAGTIFDLAPGSTIEVELTATDPDGGGETRMVTATTRDLPRRDPTTPRAVAVATAGELAAALAAAQPGDVITLADGTYAGAFSITASGTADDPIVIRGQSQAGAILDGQDCGGCNIVEVYGSHVHLQRLTIRNGVRALRFQSTGTTANVVSHVTIEDVVHGIGSGVDQTDFTICDNVVHGRLAWPLIYSDDGAIHADDQGIRVDGDGHVVCHNDISGFGDPMINFTEGGRAYDFYGNNLHEIYADGTELDRGEGNVRLFHNRFTNVFTAVSIQPARGGPTYVLRNVAVNVADEQIKLKSLGGSEEPSGVLIYHNTFVSPDIALNLQTPITQHNFVIANNLFVGPATVAGRTVDWTAAIDNGVFDYNGYFPDDGFWLGTVGSPRTYPDLAAAQAAGVEVNGRALAQPVFASGFVAPADYREMVVPPDLALADASNALDVGLAVPGINGAHIGAAPDLGARERGCVAPYYGPRPEGMEALTNPVDCSADDIVPGADGEPPGDDVPGGGGGCCQAGAGAPGGPAGLAGLVLLTLLRRRRSIS
jgi:MYXO-CTERM domain-containing protein